MVHKATVAASLSLAGIFALLGALAGVAALYAIDGPMPLTVSAGAAALLFILAGLAVLLLLSLASSWGRLEAQWCEAERVLALSVGAVAGTHVTTSWSGGSPKVCVVLGLLLASMIGAGVLQSVAPAMDAVQSNHSVEFWRALDDYWQERHWFFFRWARYASWMSVVITILEITASSILFFVDVVLIELGRTLADCFRRLNGALKQQCGQALPPSRWRLFREAYVAISGLSRVVDQHVTRLVLLALVADLSFVCIALYQGRELDSSHHFTVLSYAWALILLATRTLALLVCLSDVNERSAMGVREVFCCPARNYCTEVERLLKVATSDNVAFTGLQFFSVTRSFMLGVLGAVMTYQVLLIQSKT